jgi:hypothetical protein
MPSPKESQFERKVSEKTRLKQEAKYLRGKIRKLEALAKQRENVNILRDKMLALEEKLGVGNFAR